MTAEGLSNLLARIRDLAEQLTVPLIFAGGGSGGETWRYEPETLIAGDYWIHKVLPSLLLSVEAELVRAQEFLTGTTDASQQSEIDDTLKLLILGLAKFVSPSRVTLLPLPSPSNVQGSALDEAESQSLFPGPKGPDLISSFTGTYRNQSRAKELLRRSVSEHERLRHTASSDSASTKSVSHLLALNILQHHIKPLFSSQARQSRVSEETGRVRAERQNLSGGPGAHSLNRGGGETWHDTPWKGGATGPAWVKKMPVRIPQQGATATDETEKALALLQDRHVGLGAASVFGWTVETLGGNCSSGKGDDRHSLNWEQAWPLIVPPLVTLLEDSETNARIVGTRALYSCLLHEPLQDYISLDKVDNHSTAADGEAGDPSLSRTSSALAMPTRLLLRTGLVPLLSSVLAASMTNYSDPHSYLCLSESIACSRSLTLLTTSGAAARFERSLKPASSRPATTGSLPRNIQKEREMEETKRLVARFDQLCAIVAEGLLRPWSYITIPRSSAGMVPSASNSDPSARNTTLSALIDEFEQQQGPNAAAVDEQDAESLKAAERARAEDERETFTASVQTMLALLRTSQQLWQDIGPAGCARFADSALEVLVALLSERSTAEDEECDGPALAQLYLAFEASRAIYFISAQCTAPLRAMKHDDGSVDLRLFPPLPPDFEGRAEEVIFAAATCWIKLGLDKDDSVSTQQAKTLRDALRKQLRSMLQLVASAVPRLGSELEEQILSNDTSSRLSSLFPTAGM